MDLFSRGGNIGVFEEFFPKFDCNFQVSVCVKFILERGLIFYCDGTVGNFVEFFENSNRDF